MGIPSLFLADGTKNPECAWVFSGEGEATLMWDGEPHAVISGTLHHVSARGHWVPVTINDADACEAWARCKREGVPPDGSYELCGPRQRANPHGFSHPVLVRHLGVIVSNLPGLTHDQLTAYMRSLSHEGLVWHHPDGKRRAKLKRTDVGLRWPRWKRKAKAKV